MINEENVLDNEILNATTGKIKIYSQKAIWGFSIIFSAIFGSILLMQNLKAIGKKKEAYTVLILAIIYTIITIFIVNIPERPISSFSMLLNMLGGFILKEFFYKKHFPNDDIYDKKKIWKPLIISIIIIIPFILAILYV